MTYVIYMTFLQYDLVKNFTEQARSTIDHLAERLSGGNWVYTSAKENLNIEKAVHMMIELVRNYGKCLSTCMIRAVHI